MGRKALVPGKVTPRPCPGPGGVRTGNWLLPPSSQHRAGDTLFRIIGEERQNSWSPCKSRGWPALPGPTAELPKAPAGLGDTPVWSPANAAPHHGDMPRSPRLAVFPGAFQERETEMAGGIPDPQHLLRGSQVRQLWGAVSRWQVANTEHICGVWLMGTGTLCHGLKTTFDVAAASPFAAPPPGL